MNHQKMSIFKVGVMLVTILLVGCGTIGGTPTREQPIPTPIKTLMPAGTRVLGATPTLASKTPALNTQKALLVLKAIGLARQGSALMDSNKNEEALIAYDEATKTFDAALEVDSTDRSIWCTQGITLLTKGVILNKLNRTDEAYKVLEEAQTALKKGSPCGEFGVVIPTQTP